MEIAVVGGGIIGRTAAFILQNAGHSVTIISDKEHHATTSAVAGGLWKPVYAEPREKLIRWANATYDWFESIPAHSESGNGLQWVPAKLHQTIQDNSVVWAERVPDLRRVATALDLYDEILSTHEATLPIADMSYFLPWLISESQKIGVKDERKRIHSLDEAHDYGELVILATGLETNYLVPDAGLYPIQGQILRVENPGGIGYHQFNTDSISLYIIPRINDVVIGGTHVEHADGVDVDLALQEIMLERAIRFEPKLTNQKILSSLVGLRPGRSEVRVERLDKVIHAYGHGGSGITVSWGVALDILQLVEKAS